MHCAKATWFVGEDVAPAARGDPLEPVEAELPPHATVSSATPAMTASEPARCGQRRELPVPVFILFPPLDCANF
jgi:hypothetical protein